MTIRERITQELYRRGLQAIFLEGSGFDDAIIYARVLEFGYAQVVYSRGAIIELIMEDHECNSEDAEDHFGHNVEPIGDQEGGPLFENVPFALQIESNLDICQGYTVKHLAEASPKMLAKTITLYDNILKESGDTLDPLVREGYESVVKQCKYQLKAVSVNRMASLQTPAV